MVDIGGKNSPFAAVLLWVSIKTKPLAQMRGALHTKRNNYHYSEMLL